MSMSNIQDYAEEAHRLTDQVINDVFESYENAGQIYYMSDNNYQVKNISWLSIGDFAIKNAKRKIKEFITTWDFDENWLYCIDFLHMDEYEYDNRYRFQVKWSLPTRRKPIPRATACIYFTLQVSKIKPKSYPIDVYYVFETNRLVHQPGKSRFRECWLKDIIKSKIIMMESITF